MMFIRIRDALEKNWKGRQCLTVFCSLFNRAGMSSTAGLSMHVVFLLTVTISSLGFTNI